MIELKITDAAQMESAGNGFSQAAGQANAGMKAAITEIDGLGGCWGGDPSGQAFWSAYRAGATTVAANASQVGPQLESLGENTMATLRMYQNNEAEGAQLADGIDV